MDESCITDGDMTASCSLACEPINAWFKREILAHGDSLLRYLLRAWPNRQDAYDLRQDAYVRVYRAASKSRPKNPKSFLFATARNLLVDQARRRRCVAICALTDPGAINLMIDEISSERRAGAAQELELLAGAFDLLPPRCRNTVWLRRVDNLSQKEVATQLGVAQKTVEMHLTKGMRLLARAIE